MTAHGGGLAAGDWRPRAAAVIPGGSSTGSKRPEALYGPESPPDLPTHYESAAGCRLRTADGRTLVDCTMALGSVALGYADPQVTEAVARAVAGGTVSGLPHVREVEVAERLCEVVPCAESVRFLKSGAEAVAAAVRIARAYTGRGRVVAAGYFGWLGWWSGGTGVPAGVHEDVELVPFDDEGALSDAAGRAGDDLAAIVLEPVVERFPSPGWLPLARSLCDDVGAVLVYDEIKTGFRLHAGGMQARTGVVPDLSAFGKALANGFPLAAVVGRAGVMRAASQSWISSTLAGESASLAAAGAVLDRHAREDVCGALRRTGAAMRAAVERAIAASGAVGVRTEGTDPMWLLRFPSRAQHVDFVRAAVEAGVLFKLGAYDFASLAHDAAAIACIEQAAACALRRVARLHASA